MRGALTVYILFVVGTFVLKESRSNSIQELVDGISYLVQIWLCITFSVLMGYIEKLERKIEKIEKKLEDSNF